MFKLLNDYDVEVVPVVIAPLDVSCMGETYLKAKDFALQQKIY